MTTRTDTRLAKLYTDLPPKALAKLAFEAVAEGDEERGKFIQNAVPYRNYRTLDQDFINRYDSLSGLASVWALMAWRTLALFLVSLHAANRAEKGGDIEALGQALDAAETHEKIIAALAPALAVVCQEQDVDPAHVRGMTDAPLLDVADSIDDEIVAQIAAMLRKPFRASVAK